MYALALRQRQAQGRSASRPEHGDHLGAARLVHEGPLGSPLLCSRRGNPQHRLHVARQVGMTSTQSLILGASLLATAMVNASVDTFAQQMKSRVVRLAELHIDPSQLEE